MTERRDKALKNNKLLKEWLISPEGRQRLEQLYGQDEGVIHEQAARYGQLLSAHEEAFGQGKPLYAISAPGRTEIIGNHTDHNHGQVLAAAVNLDTAALASPREDRLVFLNSAGYPPLKLDLGDLAPQPGEAGSTAALIRGVAARMQGLGYEIGGFDAVMTSRVMSGSGLSSSAAFEVAVAAIFDALYNGFTLDAKVRAQIGQFAENAYFGKPSGLMDQMASSVGGLVAMDFKEEEPRVTALPFSFAASGFRLIVVDTRGSHDDLTSAYSAIKSEMQAAARVMGAEVLRERDKKAFLHSLPDIIRQAGDRAALRALHFYNENQRVAKAVEALKGNDLPCFFRMVRQSGLSSWTMLQNLYAHPQSQPLALALALAEEVLAGEGACRVHGGGFAGTTLNFVPDGKVDAFTRQMDAIFGEGCCHVLDVRAEGAVQVY
jgi:galactokinase